VLGFANTLYNYFIRRLSDPLKKDKLTTLLNSFAEELLDDETYHAHESPPIKRLLAICKEALSTGTEAKDIAEKLHKSDYVDFLKLIRQYQGSISSDARDKLSLRRPIAWIFTHIPADHSIFHSLLDSLNFTITPNNNHFPSTTGILQFNKGEWEVVIIHLSEDNTRNRKLIDGRNTSATALPHVVFFAGPAVHLQREAKKDAGRFVIAKSLYNRNHQKPLRVDEYFDTLLNDFKQQVAELQDCGEDQINEELESIDLKPDESLNVSEYPKPIDTSSLAWFIANQCDRKNVAIARFTICEVIDPHLHVIYI